jgi:hypothetical protein
MDAPTALRRLAEAEGYDTPEAMLKACAAGDDLCLGICLFCGNVCLCEPDARRNWCVNCTANNVHSAFVLAEWI